MRGSIALLEGDEPCGEVRLHSLQTHSTNLLSSIDFLLSNSGWTLKDLNLIAVGNGPGSFTGIRIGIATALGFSRSLSIPFAGISGLDALAHQVSYLEGRIGVILNAHRSQAFYAEYVGEKGRIRKSQKSQLIDISALEHHLRDRHLYLVGDTDLCRLDGSKAVSPAWPRLVSTDLFLAVGIGRLALANKRKWRSSDSVISEPTYIRPPDALKKKKH
ncbi:MAG: tRNA (adenosine(37)-N6)-threonylcarbamoyltransferase complex dimerization subunit type 1 TsaB [Acidobacteria bacterium]|nr:tRNA (adenosine(37)-N6)-threonylcarbamoyltransferase complex dimerization subunit type 1 TsaB [Acidobacteriota bacterium]